MTDTIKTIAKVILDAKDKGTSPYDTTAEVVRIDGQTAWCHIAGGIDETPVNMTIAASVGDIVQVRIAGGRAWITGNQSAPPTDDTVANVANKSAKDAKKTADDAQVTAENAEEVANAANRAAQNVNQYFWHTETDTGAGAGAHITEVTQEEFLDDPSNGGGNLLAQSGGIFIRDGLTELASMTSSGAKFKEMSANAYSVEVGATGFVVNKGATKAAEIRLINAGGNDLTIIDGEDGGITLRTNTGGSLAVDQYGNVSMTNQTSNAEVMVTQDDKVLIDGAVYMRNPDFIYSQNSGGDARSIIGINASSQLVIGYGLYANDEGTTYLEGNNVQILSKNDVKASNAGGTAHCVGTMDTMTATQHSTSTGSVASNTDSGGKTATFTKSGYYPLGIVGINMAGTNRMYQNIYEYRLSSRSSGSATLTYRFRNGSAAAFNGTLYVDILWIKI